MKAKDFCKKAASSYAALGRRIGVLSAAPTKGQTQTALFVLGLFLLSAGLVQGANAAAAGTGGGLSVTYNDVRISNSVNVILTAIEGTFGALVMVSAGIGAILSSAFGQYRAALGLLVVAVGSFILRSVLGTFFNDSSIAP